MKAITNNHSYPFNVDHASAAKLFIENHYDTMYIRATKQESPIYFMSAFVALLRRVDEIVLSTFNINFDATEQIISILPQVTGSVYLLFNDSQIRMNTERISTIMDMLNQHRGEIIWSTSNNHSKVIAIRQGCECIIIEGSGNFAQNSNLEQFTISRSPMLYALNREVILQRIGRPAPTANTDNPFSEVLNG